MLFRPKAIRCWAPVLLFLFWTVPLRAENKASTHSPEAGVVDSAQVPDDAAERIWIEPGQDDPGAHESIRVRYVPQHVAGGVLIFDCDAHCGDAIDNGTLRLQVKDVKGKILYSGDVSMPLQAGSNPAHFEWPTENLADGDYTAHFLLTRRPGIVVAAHDLRVRKLSRDAVAAELDCAEQRIAALREHMSRLGSPSAQPPYARMRTAIASDAIAEGRAAFLGKRWPRASGIARYVQRTAEGVSAQLALGGSARELFEPIPEPGLSGITISSNGGFVAGERPIFLFGASGTAHQAGNMARLRQYGLNFFTFSLSPADTLASENADADFKGAFTPLLEDAKRLNVAVGCVLSQNNLPDWAWKRWPAMQCESASGGLIVDLTHPGAQALIARHLTTALPWLKEQPMIVGVAIIDQPEFAWSGPSIRDGFVAHVKSIYKDRDAVNAAWRKRLRTLEEVDIWRDHPKPAYQYDWQSYHAQLGSEYLADLKARAVAAAPGLPLGIEVTDAALKSGKSEEGFARDDAVNALLTADTAEQTEGRGDAAEGVDRETIAQVFDLNACQASARVDDPVYAMAYPRQSLFYTLLRSFAPRKPIVNFEDRFLDGAGGDPARAHQFIYSALWEAVMSGLNASATPLGETDNLAGALGGGVFSSPECLEAYATASLDINRLAPIVTAFQQAPADVAILWSMPSKIYDRGHPYLSSLRRAYEGCSFAGRKVRFVTENQCVRGGLEGVAILVLPQMLTVAETTFKALDNYLAADGVVLRSGVPIPYDERGASRQDVITSTLKTVLVRGVDSAAQYLHAMDAAYALGTVQDVPRAVNAMGYPFEGVKTLYTEFDGERYLYLINLRTTAVTCKLVGKVQTGRDLIRGCEVAFPATIAPLEPMLIRLDHVESAPAPTVAAAAGTPTAVLKPAAP